MKKTIFKAFIFLILTCVAGYLIWDNTKPDLKENTTETSLEEGTKYFNKIKLSRYFSLGDIKRATYFYNNTDNRLTKLDVNYLISALDLDIEANEGLEKGNWVSRVSEDNINEKFNELYGDNAAYNHLDSINYNCYIYNYNESDGYYYDTNIKDINCSNSVYSLNEVVFSYKKLTDHLEIDTYTYVFNYEEDYLSIYNYDKLDKVIAKIPVIDEFDGNIDESEIIKYKDKLHKYRYVFNKGIDGKYYLAKIIKL